jgi:endonuclease III
VTKKSESAAKLLAKIPLAWPLPDPLEDGNLLEQGLYAILRRQLEPGPAQACLAALKKHYTDWNELRVAQAQEILTALEGIRLGDKAFAVARDIKEYLQEVFQRSHGLDLEFLRDDPAASARFVSQLPFIGMGTANYLMWLASNHDLGVTPPLVRVLDRIGLIARSGSLKKARAAIEPLVPDQDYLQFAVRFGEVASRWCDARKPLCHMCVLVAECKYGKKAYREWKGQQERLVVQRARDAARQAVLQKKEDERRSREEAKAAKKAAAEAARRAREDEKKAKIVARKKAIEDARKAKEAARQDGIRKRAEAKAAEIEKKRQARDAKLREAAAKKAAEKAAREKAAREREKLRQKREKAAAKKARPKKPASARRPSRAQARPKRPRARKK